MHSDASDGTVAPEQVAAQAHQAGLDVFALTDHDTTGGWARAAAALPAGLTLLPAAELSCVHWDGDRRIGIHLLAYLFDRDEPNLRAARRRLREGRLVRGRRMVERIAAAGYPLTWSQVRGLAGGEAVGRPHIARALVAAGVVPDVPAAFTPDWIGHGGRFTVNKEELPVLDAVALVRGAGGVAVFAHPGAFRRGPVVADTVIAALAAAGLAGLEVDHPDHDPPTRAHLRALAADLNLLVTGGSDFHGASKPVSLGAEGTSAAALERLLGLATGSKPVIAQT